MKEVTVRVCSIDQIDALVRWRMRVVREVFAGCPEAADPALCEANRRYYLRSLADGSHVAVFAYSGEEIIGCGGVCFQTEMPSPDNRNGLDAYLMNIFVDPSWRHRHAGRAIVEKLLEIARQRDAGKIYLETSECGRPLYRTLGFTGYPDMMKFAQHG